MDMEGREVKVEKGKLKGEKEDRGRNGLRLVRCGRPPSTNPSLQYTQRSTVFFILSDD